MEGMAVQCLSVPRPSVCVCACRGWRGGGGGGSVYRRCGGFFFIIYVFVYVCVSV